MLSNTNYRQALDSRNHQTTENSPESTLMIPRQMMQFSSSRTSILWRQVWGLAALLAAILLSFMAYGLYQPIILRSLGFVELAGWLGIAQGVLGAIIEPFVGAISDSILHYRELGKHQLL